MLGCSNNSSNNPNKISLSAHVRVVVPPEQPIQAQAPNQEIYYNAIESDKNRLLNGNFGKNNFAYNKVARQQLSLIRTDGTEKDKQLVSVHAIPEDSTKNIRNSFYTYMTLATGLDENGKRNYFYVNPKHIALCMEYCRNVNYYSWGTFQKYKFDEADYDECLSLVIEKSAILQYDAEQLLDDNYTSQMFDPLHFLPLCYLGGFDKVLIVLRKLENGTTINAPYALKLVKIQQPETSATANDLLIHGAKYERYYHSIMEHPNILRMFDHFDYVDNWRCELFELLPYGSMRCFTYSMFKRGNQREPQFEFICELARTEKKVNVTNLLRFYSAQILMALEYLHELGIMHFDIRAETIGIGYRGYVKLCNFDRSFHQRKVKYTYDSEPNVSGYECKEKQKSVHAETMIDLGTDIYGFSITFLSLFSNWISDIRYDEEEFHEENDKIQKDNQKYAESNLSKEEIEKIKLADSFKVANQCLRKWVSLNNETFEALKENDPEINDMYEVFLDSFHFDDHENRKSAKELLDLKFFDPIDKEMLFKQSYDLEEEINFDLRDVFVANYYWERQSGILRSLGKRFCDVKEWYNL